MRDSNRGKGNIILAIGIIINYLIAIPAFKFISCLVAKRFM